MKTLLIITSLISAQAFAFTPVLTTFKQAIKQIETQKRNTVRKVDENKCTSFAGKWKGVCENAEGKSENIVEISQNGCVNLYFTSVNDNGEKHSESYDLTGMGIKSQSNSSSQSTFGMHLASKWNNDQTVAQFEVVGLVNTIYSPKPLTVTVSGQLLRDGDRLQMFSHVEGDMQNTGDSTCRYELIK